MIVSRKLRGTESVEFVRYTDFNGFEGVVNSLVLFTWLRSSFSFLTLGFTSIYVIWREMVCDEFSWPIDNNKHYYIFDLETSRHGHLGCQKKNYNCYVINIYFKIMIFLIITYVRLFKPLSIYFIFKSTLW